MSEFLGMRARFPNPSPPSLGRQYPASTDLEQYIKTLNRARN